MTLIKDYIKIFLKQLKWIILLLLLFVIYEVLVIFVFKLDTNCMIKLIFGIPCPSCGMTRAYLSLFRLNIISAFYYHPLFWLVPIVAFIIIFRERPFWSKLYHSKLFWSILFTVYIFVYIIRFILIYPNPPMDIDRPIFLK